MRTKGTNLAYTNPYLQKTVPFRSFEDIKSAAI